MAGHEAKIIEVRQINDSAVAILARCCDDEITDSWHVEYDLEKLDPAMEQHRQSVAARHEKMSGHLERLRSQGHSVTSGHTVKTRCEHCGRGTMGTVTHGKAGDNAAAAS